MTFDKEWFLEERLSRGRYMLEKCEWILSAICDGLHSHPDIEAQPILDELILFRRNQPEWEKKYNWGVKDFHGSVEFDIES